MAGLVDPVATRAERAIHPMAKTRNMFNSGLVDTVSSCLMVSERAMNSPRNVSNSGVRAAAAVGVNLHECAGVVQME